MFLRESVADSSQQSEHSCGLAGFCRADYVVQLVLDTPMPPVELEQLRRPGLRTRLAADEIDPLEAGGVLADLEDFALEAGHLRGVREVHIAAQSLAGPDAACFHAAMRLVQRD